jgi:hypothetical protein
VKSSVTTLAAVLVVSLAVWSFFYVAMPASPLTAGETAIIVGASAAVVLLVRRLWLRVRTRTGSDAPPP